MSGAGDDAPLASVFAPPHEARADGWQGLMVAGVWALAGGVVGAAIGLSFDLSGGAGLAARATVVGALFGGLAGGLAWRVERLAAADRPDVADLRGQVERRAHAALFLAPLAFVVLPLLWIAVLVAVAIDARWPLAAVGLLVLSVGWPARRLLSRQALLRGIESLERHDLAEARDQLAWLARARWASAAARDAARLNLGLLALREGAVAPAIDWLDAVRDARVRPHALGARAVALAVADRRDDAARAIQAALTQGGVEVAAEVDAARLLLVWRAEGPLAARAFGERLGTHDAGALFLGLLAALRHQAGDHGGAAELLDGGVRDALVGWPLCRALPELAPILVAPPR